MEREADIKQITVTDRLDAPSSFQIAVSDTGGNWVDNDDYFSGAGVEIHLGYKDEVKKMITGEVTGVAMHKRRNLSDIVKITGKNKLHRLQRNRRTASFTGMTEEDIIKRIVNDTGISTGEIENLTYKHLFTLQREKTDYEYLLELAGRYNCNFWVSGDKFYFKRLTRNAAEDLVLEYGKTLKELYPAVDTSRVISEVEVRGWNFASGECITGTAVYSDIDSPAGKSIDDNWGGAKGILIDHLVQDRNTADQLALDLLTSNSRRAVTGTGRCQGNPSIKAGSILKLEGLGSRFSGKYFITRASHTLKIAGAYETGFMFTSSIASSAASGAAGESTVVSDIGTGPGVKESTWKPEKAEYAPFEKTEQDEQKQPALVNLKWIKGDEEISKALVGDNVYMTAEARDIDDGNWVRVRLFEKDYVGENDFISQTYARITGGKIRLEWEVEYHEDLDDINSRQEQEELGYTLPEYIFVLDTAQPEEIKSGDSPVLEVRGWIRTKLVDKKTGKVMKNREYIIYLSDGTEIEGKTDEDGYVEIKDLEFGKYYLLLK